MITFECPHCHKSLKAAGEHAGKKAKCNGCRKSVDIPMLAIGTPEEKQRVFDALPPMKLADEEITPVVSETKSKPSWKGFILTMLGISLVCFFYFLLRSNYYPIGDGSMTMYSSTMADERINGMIGSGVAVAVCFATLFYLKINSRNAGEGQ